MSTGQDQGPAAGAVGGMEIAVTASAGRLPDWGAVAVVIAHPDDESFGLGAVIDAFVRSGTSVSVLCFTQGEASTLGADADDLASVRALELADAARALGVVDVELLAFPDGGLAEIDGAELVARITDHCAQHRPDGLLVFDPSGITGHLDHQAATAAALTAAQHLGLPVLSWSLPTEVADALSEETGVRFYGRDAADLDIRITVSRERQREAVSCHPSQAVPGSALWRRLEMLGDSEHLMWLLRP
jgi:LmbE family N-acetylglucosaminyl deacetylase